MFQAKALARLYLRRKAATPERPAHQMAGFRPRLDSTLLSSNPAVLDLADANNVAPDSPAVELLRKKVHIFFKGEFERLLANNEIDLEANLN